MAVLAAGILLLAGCSTEGDPEPAADTSQVALRTPVPTPSAAEVQELLDGLEQIDSSLVDDHAVQDARNVCGALRDGGAPSIDTRFEVNLSDEGEQKVVDLIRETFCPW